MAKKRTPRPRHQETTVFDQYRPVLDRVLFIVALVGMLVAAHLYIQQGRGFDRGCLGFSAPTGVAADCAVVTNSAASNLFGVSNAVWGFGFYLVLAGLGFALLYAAGDRRKLLNQLRALLIGGGFLYSMYLVGYQVVSIGEYCVLCLTSAGIVTLMLGLKVYYLAKPLQQNVRAAEAEQAERRPKEARLFAAMAVGLVVLLGVDFTYFNALDAAAGSADNLDLTRPVAEGAAAADEHLPGECRYDPEKPRVADFNGLISDVDPYRGNPAAPVKVIEYFDPNCPHCRTTYPIMKEVEERFAETAVFYYKPFVIFQQSVGQSAALYAAAREGKFFEMLELQFANQSSRGLSEPQMRAMFEHLGMDADRALQRVSAGLWFPELDRQKLQGQEIGLTAVPTILINGKFVDGHSRTVACITQLLEAEGATATAPAPVEETPAATDA